MKNKLMVGTLVMVLLVGIVAPNMIGQASAAVPAAPAASVSQSHPALFDKTRFLLHMGLAYFAFHHWVYKPFKAGAFDKGANHRLIAIGKAGIALLFAYHEVKTAYDIANKSNSHLLHGLIAPLKALQNAAQSVGNKFKAGNYDSADITNLNNLTTNLGRSAKSAGYNIQDKSVPIPGLT